MAVLTAPHVLLPDGWASPGYVHIAVDGSIEAVGEGRPPVDDSTTQLDGYLLPGMANAHSHAHHRALVGYADRMQSGASENLWSWREAMYANALTLSPEDLEAQASMAFLEMVKRGYTSVGEFHYIHKDPHGHPYADPTEMSRRIGAAAERVGIALTILPVLYQQGGIGAPPAADQRRFVLSTADYAALVHALQEDSTAHRGTRRVGIAPHSLRAVEPDALATVLAEFPDVPVHIHVSERVEEVEEVVAGLGARPVQWLLDNCQVDERWALVHCTHLDRQELDLLGGSGAVAALCPLTESNLADGRFELPTYLEAGGRIAIGTDANHLIELAGELRMLEYGQRLFYQRRNTLLAGGESSVGRLLFERALRGGAQALRQPTGRLEVGARADIVELDPNSPALLGQTPETVIDAWIFSSSDPRTVRTVLVGGQRVVSDGHHRAEDEIEGRFADLMQQRVTDL